MATLFEAAEFAMRWAENQRGMVAVAEVLQTLGSLDQALKERKEALDAATKAHEAKLAEVAVVRQEMAALSPKWDAEIEAHRMRVVEWAAKHKREADAAIAETKRQTDMLVAAAKAEIELIQQAHSETMDARTAELAAIATASEEAQKKLEAANEAHYDIQTRVAEMRAAALRVVG